MQQTTDALHEFTTRYCDAWQQRTGHAPASQALAGVPSPCIVATQPDEVWWQPQPFTLPATLEAVERALDIQLQEEITAFYTSQFAGDMAARFEQWEFFTLLQVWSEEDFLRLQENPIRHLVMKRRLKQTPTIFIAATESEQRSSRSAISRVKLFSSSLALKIAMCCRKTLIFFLLIYNRLSACLQTMAGVLVRYFSHAL